MGLDIFPLLQNHTCLILYNNTVFKLKLEYKEVSQQKKETFACAVSEQAAHSQIEDVCRAVLYIIEREKELSPLQTNNFIIYPEVHQWPLVNKVRFIVDGQQLSSYKYLILLKLTLKDVVPDSQKDNVAVLVHHRDRSLHSQESFQNTNTASNNYIQKTGNVLCLYDRMTDDSAEAEAVTCAENSVIIFDTPVLGTNNTKGGQSVKSSNKITVLIQEHSNMFQMAAINNQCNILQFKGKHLARNQNTYEDIGAASKIKSTRSEEPYYEKSIYPTHLCRNKKQMVNKMAVFDARTDSSSSETQKTDSVKQFVRQSAQQTKRAINVMIDNTGNMHWSEVSNRENSVKLSGMSYIPSEKDFASVGVRNMSKKTVDICNEEELKVSNNKKRKHNMPEQNVKSEFLKRKNIYNEFVHDKIGKKEQNYVSSTQTERLPTCAATVVMQNLETDVKNKIAGRVSREQHTHRRRSSKKAWVKRERTESESDRYFFRGRRRSHVPADDMYKHTESLMMSDDSVEVTGDGSFIYESSSLGKNHTLALENQNGNSSSSEFSDNDKDLKQKCRTGDYSQENNDFLSSSRDKHEQLNRLESKVAKMNFCNYVTPSKSQGIQTKAHDTCFSDYSKKGNVKICGKKEYYNKERTNLDHSNQSEGESENSFATVRNKGNVENETGSCEGHSYKSFHRSDVPNLTKHVPHEGNQSLRSAVTSVNYSAKIHTRSQKISHMHQDSNKQNTTKRTCGHSLHDKKNELNMMVKKSVANDCHRQTVPKTSDRRNITAAHCSPRATKSLSGSPSQQEYKWFRILRSKSANLLHSLQKKTRGNGFASYMSENQRHLNEAQQHLLKSKDGVWLF